MVPARLARIEADWHLHHGTRRQNICLEVNLQVRGVLELALDAEEGGSGAQEVFQISL